MDSMRRIELGDSGLSYMRESLARGQSFGEFLEGNLGERKGRVFTDVPQEVSSERAHRFGSAFLMRSVGPRGHGLARLLVGELTQPDVVLVVEDDLSERGDKWLTSHGEAPLHFGPRVYWVLRSASDLSSATVEKFLSYCYSYSLVAAIVPHPGMPLSPGSELSLGELSEFANRASVVVVSAYDNTGYLYWIPYQGDTSKPLWVGHTPLTGATLSYNRAGGCPCSATN